jgi:hypothetical protein
MKTQRIAEVPATWRDHFEIPPAAAEPESRTSELDAIQPGHSRGITLLLLVMLACCAALIYGMTRDIPWIHG